MADQRSGHRLAGFPALHQQGRHSVSKICRKFAYQEKILFTDHLDLHRSSARPCLVEIDEIDVTEVPQVQFAVDHNNGFASSHQCGTEMGVCVAAGLFILAMFHPKFFGFRPRVTIHPVITKGRHDLLQRIHKILLQCLQPILCDVECILHQGSHNRSCDASKPSQCRCEFQIHWNDCRISIAKCRRGSLRVGWSIQ